MSVRDAIRILKQNASDFPDIRSSGIEGKWVPTNTAPVESSCFGILQSCVGRSVDNNVFPSCLSNIRLERNY